MRHLAAFLGFAVAVPVVSAQGMPTKAGLWETTAVLSTTYSAGIAASIKSKGVRLPPTVVKKKHLCRAASQAAVPLLEAQRSWGTAGPGCSITKHELTSTVFNSIQNCPDFKGKGSGLEIQFFLTVDSPFSMHGFQRATMTFPPEPLANQSSIVEGRLTARFLTADCGAIKPGEEVEVR